MILTALFPFLLIAQGQPVTLTADTFNLTGTHSIQVSNLIQGVPGTVIRYDSLEPSDSTFLFIALSGAEFHGITFIGANGNTHTSRSGYIGCIRIRQTAKIVSCTFDSWDKWCLDFRGNRKTLTDTSYVTDCTFRNIKRDGYGYSIWSQYATVVVDSCRFYDGRHFIDGGSEGHRFILRGCTFDRSYMAGVHTHEYTGGMSGAGMDIIGCTFNRSFIEIDPPFPPCVNRIENNTYWNGQGTSFWIKSHGADVEIIGADAVVVGDEWQYLSFRVKVTIRISGTGVVYIDDYIEPFASRYYTMEDKALPRIRYITPAKVDRFVGDQVSGDQSLRVRVAEQVVEVY